MTTLSIIFMQGTLAPYIPIIGWVVFLALAGLIGGITYFGRRVKAQPAPDYKQMMRDAVALLSSEVKDMTKQENHVLLFAYQDSHFLLTYEDEGTYHLCMPQIMIGSATDLNVIRASVNEINQDKYNEHLFYTLDREEGKVVVFIKIALSGATTPEGLADDMRGSITRMFNQREKFYRKEISWEVLGKNMGCDDMERHIMENAFERTAITQQEARHLMPRPERTSDSRRPMLLGTLLLRLCDSGLPPFRGLQVVTENDMWSSQDANEIHHFDTLSPVIERDAEGVAHVKSHSATLLVRCNAGSEQTSPDELLTITLQVENQTEAAIYVRATICRTPVPGNGMETVSDDSIYMDNLSLTLAATIQPEDKRISEIDYMWHEAMDAKAKGDYNDLSEEERYMLFYALDRDVYESIYWGRKLMLEKRYYEALLYLECAYEALAPQYDSLKREGRERFYELCYQIGFCYNELRLYKEAYVYLEAVAGKNNLNYTMEYVNCLVNSKDHRALGVVNNLIGQAEHYQNDTEGEMPDGMQNFYDFLRRRKAFLLVDTDRLDDAEQLLKSMLREPGNCDFALDELAYIQNLRRDKAGDAEENP